MSPFCLGHVVVAQSSHDSGPFGATQQIFDANFIGSDANVRTIELGRKFGFGVILTMTWRPISGSTHRAFTNW
jgi:hypothetical protein